MERWRALGFLQFGVGEEKGFSALGVEVDFNLIILGYFIVVNAENSAKPEDTMRDAIVLLPGG